MSLIALAWPALILSGCSPTGEAPTLLARASLPADPGLTRSPANRGSIQIVEEVHDFGTILAHGQTLDHAFEVVNPADRPIRLTGVTSSRPCCSKVGPLPEAIAPGGTAPLTLSLRPGEQYGPRSLQFVAFTDDPDRPTRRFTLVANLVTEVEVRGDGGFPGSLPMGVAGKVTLDVICRRTKSEGLGPPDSVKAEGATRAGFVGESTEATLTGDLIETTRRLEVVIPAGSEAGFRRGTLQLLWPGGHERSHTIAWEVTPRIVATPSALTIEPSKGEQTKTVVLRSTDRPFRIRSVAGTLLARSSHVEGSEAAQRVDVVLDPSRSREGTAHDLRIETDHPDQPVVTISVLLLPGTGEAKP